MVEGGGETVLDPFLGSGTTLVACKQLGRRGIGIEISKEYCRTGANRLDNEPMPLPYEKPAKEKVTQKQLC